jgi:hypothetical protein
MNERPSIAARHRNGIGFGNPGPYRIGHEGDDDPVVSSTFRKDRPRRADVRETMFPKGSPTGDVLPSTNTLVETRTSSPTSYGRQSSPDEESHATEMPFDMAHDETCEKPALALTSLHPTFGPIGERMQSIIAIPQQSGNEYFIKRPRYSDPYTTSEDPPAMEQLSFEQSGGKGEKIGSPQAMQEQPRTTKFVQRGAGQWVRADDDGERRSAPVNYEGRQLIHDQNPPLEQEVENEVQNVIERQIPDQNRRPVKVASNTNSVTFLPAADETSTETNVRSPTNLHERSLQAWRYRQKKNKSLKKAVDIFVEESQPHNSTSPQQVQFEGDNDVQSFDAPMSEVTDISFEDEKSLSSEYTKTLESEVEDLIKDVLFIGNGNTSRPGRRQYRYKHEVKRRLKERSETGMTKSRGKLKTLHELDEDGAAPSKVSKLKPSNTAMEALQPLDSSSGKPNGEAGRNRKSSKSAQKPRKSNDLSDAEETLWNFVEGGMAAMSEVLGLAPATAADKTSRVGSEWQSPDDYLPDPIISFADCSGGKRFLAEESATNAGMSEVIGYAQSRVDAQLAQPNEVRMT